MIEGLAGIKDGDNIYVGKYAGRIPENKIVNERLVLLGRVELEDSDYGPVDSATETFYTEEVELIRGEELEQLIDELDVEELYDRIEAKDTVDPEQLPDIPLQKLSRELVLGMEILRYEIEEDRPATFTVLANRFEQQGLGDEKVVSEAHDILDTQWQLAPAEWTETPDGSITKGHRIDSQAKRFYRLLYDKYVLDRY